MKNHENQPGTMKNKPGTMKNHENPSVTMKNREKPNWNHKNHENRPGTMNNQPGTMKNQPWLSKKRYWHGVTTDHWDGGGGRGSNKQKRYRQTDTFRYWQGDPTDLLDV